MMETAKTIVRCKAILIGVASFILASLLFTPQTSHAQDPATKFLEFEERLASDVKGYDAELAMYNDVHNSHETQWLGLAHYYLQKDAHDLIVNITHEIRRLYNSQQYETARVFAGQALRISERYLGPEDPVTAIGLNNLAVIYANENNVEKAKTLSLNSNVIAIDAFDLAHCAKQSIGDTFFEIHKFNGEHKALLPILDIRSIANASACSDYPYEYSYEKETYSFSDLYNHMLLYIVLLYLIFGITKVLERVWGLSIVREEKKGLDPELRSLE